MLLPCKSCGTRLQITPAHLGARVKCPGCGAGISVPRNDSTPAPARPAPEAGGLSTQGIVIAASAGAVLLLTLIIVLLICLSGDGDPAPKSAQTAGASGGQEQKPDPDE